MRHGLRVAVAVLACLGLATAAYVSIAYEFVPSAWRFVERRHPALAGAGTRAFTAAGVPGDPLNVAFIGSGDRLETLMAQAHWYPADAVTFKSSVRIAVDSLSHRSYQDAPVSSLFVNGRRQDLAFEQSTGDPSKRHHVRFWRMDGLDLLGRSLWIGAATYDSGIGLSHTTLQITHHIDADVDRERDKLAGDLQAQSGEPVAWISDFQPDRRGRNGGGDAFFTDGRLAVFEDATAPVSHPGER